MTQATIEWSPDVDWLLAVLVLHAWLVAVWFFVFGLLAVVVGLVSLGRAVHIFAGRERWLLEIRDDRLVILGPRRDRSGYRETVHVAASGWMIDAAVVIPTPYRVLLIRRRALSNDHFAMLRRALLGVSTSSGSTSGSTRLRSALARVAG